MQKFYELSDALCFIEEHLESSFTQKQVAEAACISLSGLHKLFRYTFGYSVNDYVTKRRMTEAAKALIKSEETVTDIALRYSYQSPEAFNRVFKRTWNTNPSKYRKNKRYVELFSEVSISDMKMECFRNVTKLYDWTKSASHKFVICFDVTGLILINKISWEAGDMVLLETVKRIEKNIQDKEMCIFRIGGDEFALTTPYDDVVLAENLMIQILSHNGEPIEYKGEKIPVILRGWYGYGVNYRDTCEMSEYLRKSVKYNGTVDINKEIV